MALDMNPTAGLNDAGRTFAEIAGLIDGGSEVTQ